MGRENQGKTSFMRRLQHDTAANTLVICAAALIPMMAMVGSGIDASRYYMTASRMQAACDAGALAARRAMTDDTFTSSHRQLGIDFFDQNFPDDMFGSANRSRNYTSDGQGVVLGTANSRLPTTIMAAFGFDEFNIAVSCSAEINISNSDIMFVLDVTGSMSSCSNGNQCNSNSNSKIAGLREAVMSFYDTVEDATSASAQIRYGFVPYSQQINVGALLPRAYLADEHTYQSRVAMFEEVERWRTYSDKDEWLPRDPSNFNSGNAADLRFKNKKNKPKDKDKDDEKLCNGMSGIIYSVGGERWDVRTVNYILNQWDTGSNDDRAGCQGRVVKERLETQVEFVGWRYCPVDTADSTPCNVNNPVGSLPGWETVNLSTLYDDNKINLPTGNGGAMEEHTWEGCIEEPVWMDPNGNYIPIPAAAHDLDINLVPQNEGQRWKPALNRAAFERRNATGGRITGWRDVNNDQSRPGWSCPKAARKLAEINRADLQTYVNGLVATGNTYHDIGMVWGARLLSPNGIFATENQTAPNGDAISRHLVFMTDGELFTNIENYTPHGIEWWDRRVTGNGNRTRDMERRAARLQAICRAAQQENITVWVVAFGTALTQNLIDCASPGRAFQAGDSATLTARFQEIAQKIAALRLTS